MLARAVLLQIGGSGVTHITCREEIAGRSAVGELPSQRRRVLLLGVNEVPGLACCISQGEYGPWGTVRAWGFRNGPKWAGDNQKQLSGLQPRRHSFP